MSQALAPGRLFFASVLLATALCAAAIVLRLSLPTLGLVFSPSIDSVQVELEGRPFQVEQIAAGERRVALELRDLVEEPDYFDTYPEMAEFFGRQSELAEIVRAPELVLVLRGDDGQPQVRTFKPRPATLADLPAVFWFQIAAAMTAVLLSLWALVLRPRELAVRIFALLGGSIALFVLPAAIYSTRELAIDGALFRALSALNQTGANLFGCALITFFLCYPKRLTRRLWVVPAIVLSWLAFNLSFLAPDLDWGSRIPTLLEMLVALLLGAVQWRKSRGDPRARAGLRWLGVSLLAGSSLFVGVVVGSSTLGWFPPIPQGYSFGFFLLMHAAFAFGLGRHRLFELDEWAYRLLLWVLAGLLLLAVDAALVLWLGMSRVYSSGAMLLASLALYVPLRGWLWSRIVARRSVPEHEIFEAVLGVTFSYEPAQRVARWRALLQKLFDPMTMTELAQPEPRSRILDEGASLLVAGGEPGAGASLPALRLDLPWRGRGLFGPKHLQLVDNLRELLQQAENQRIAFERGAMRERARIARDMHDDLGAGLLSSLHQADLDTTRDSIRQALGDMRSIVNELTYKPLTIAELCAELRQESVRRLEAVDLEIEWTANLDAPTLVVAQGVYRHCTSMLRELCSNVIRHAGAKRVWCSIEVRELQMSVRFADDGRGLAEASTRGRGLENLTRRSEALGGSFELSRQGAETVAQLKLRLTSPDDASRTGAFDSVEG